MDDETPDSGRSSLLLIAGASACGVAACFSGGLALIGATLLLVAFAATGRSEPEFGCVATEPPPCNRPACPSDEPPCVALALDSGTHWRQAIAEQASCRAAGTERAGRIT